MRSNERVDSWSKALAVYKSLSSKLIENGSDDLKRGVPVKIRLLPKRFFGIKHETLSKELQSNVVDRSVEVIEFLTEAINESRDLLNETEKFPILKKK